MPDVTCPVCAHSWDSVAKSRTRCGSCGKVVSVSGASTPDRYDPEPSEDSPTIGLGFIAVGFCCAGVWMLQHARTADPQRQAPGYKAWHWTAGGVGCVGIGLLLGYLAVQRALSR